MNLTSFTVEQENLLCIYNTSNRIICIAEITSALPNFDDPDICEIAKSTIAILQTMTDEEFSALVFSPTYHNDEEEG